MYFIVGISSFPGNPYKDYREGLDKKYGIDAGQTETPSMHIKQALRLWLFNKAGNTKSTYGQIVADWLSHVPHDRMLEPTTRDVYEYLVYLERKKGTKTRNDLEGNFWPSTIRKYITCLRSFYNFLVTTNAAESNPFLDPSFDLGMFKVSQKRPTEFIEFDAVERILAAYSERDGKTGIRNRAIMAVLFGTGLRKSEVRNLLLGDVRKTPAGTWYVHLRHTKSKRDRSPALGDWALGPMLTYRQQRIDEGAKDSSPLFVGYEQSTERPAQVPMAPKTLYLIFKYAAARAGVSSAATFHSGRATVVSKLLNDGAEYREVQEVTGHSSVQMVESYDKRQYGPDKSATKKLGWGDGSI